MVGTPPPTSVAGPAFQPASTRPTECIEEEQPQPRPAAPAATQSTTRVVEELERQSNPAEDIETETVTDTSKMGGTPKPFKDDRDDVRNYRTCCMMHFMCNPKTFKTDLSRINYFCQNMDGDMSKKWAASVLEEVMEDHLSRTFLPRWSLTCIFEVFITQFSPVDEETKAQAKLEEIKQGKDTAAEAPPQSRDLVCSLSSPPGVFASVALLVLFAGPGTLALLVLFAGLGVLVPLALLPT
ncbi:hypothetical protein K488DRAFT_91051 [Vararia minispora EC-137]|uniref:Uncharacterized protein n=1 Tax=Vararia minispora EC-137 TaxID=1314806 RepID=A0ACB8Q6M1_9AGAM|nr:hypothetical protein K488DRAFT_91051 [Vararia minispora EC-137]